MSLSGVVNIYKEAGFTSHDAVNVVRGALRKKYGKIKVGHTGTLDPDAVGVLPVCIGRATKLADMIGGKDKCYRAVIRLGTVTDTQDTSGTVLAQHLVTVTQEEFIKAAISFVGEYMQKPPMYSAVKVGGKKLYELARQGIEVERKARNIRIIDITDIKRRDNEHFEFTAECSKGTYIRTLCADIGESLGCGACMAHLERIRSGMFDVSSSITLDEFKSLCAEGKEEEAIIQVGDLFPELPKLNCRPDADKYLKNGNKISPSFVLGEGERALLYSADGTLYGLYTLKEGAYVPEVMLVG